MPTLRSLSSSAKAISVESLLALFLCSGLYFLQCVPFINDSQSFEGQEFIHGIDAGALRSDQRRQSAGGGDLGRRADLLLHAPHDAVHQTDIAEENTRLNRLHGITADDFVRPDDLDPGQLRGTLKQRLHRYGTPRSDGAAYVLAFLRNMVDGGRGA